MNLQDIVNNEKTDKDTVHSYLPEYQKLFSKIRERVENVLEIGIGRGGSLALWNDYFPNATIYGLDDLTNGIEEGINGFHWVRDYDRIKILVPYDAYNPKTLDLFKDTKFDIIIDDGPHTLKTQIYCAKNYTKLLKKGGILVIEDIEGVNIEPIKNAFDNIEKVKCKDLRHHKSRYDDVLIIYEN